MWVGNPEDKPKSKQDHIDYYFVRALYFHLIGDSFSSLMSVKSAMNFISGKYSER